MKVKFALYENSDKTVGNVSTGCYADWEEPEKNEFLVSISNTVPKSFYVDEDWETVHPGQIVWSYRKGLINELDYTSLYLRTLTAKKELIAKELANLQSLAGDRTIVLLCWEQEGQFCHRHLLFEFLQAEGLIHG